MKFKKPTFKIKMRLSLLWQVTLLAFFAVFVVVLALNIYVFFDLRHKLSAGVDQTEFYPKILDESLLKAVVEDSESRKTVFEGAFLIKPDIEDPFGLSLPEVELE